MSLLIFFLGLAVGLVSTVVWLSYWAATDEGQRQLANWRAEQRIRDVQTTAMTSIADAAEDAIRRSTALGFTDRDIDLATSAWPSEARGDRAGEDVIEGVVVVDDRRKD